MENTILPQMKYNNELNKISVVPHPAPVLFNAWLYGHLLSLNTM